MALTDFLGGIGGAMMGGPQNMAFGLAGQQQGVNPMGLLGQFLGIPDLVQPQRQAPVGTPGINPEGQQPSSAPATHWQIGNEFEGMQPSAAAPMAPPMAAPMGGQSEAHNPSMPGAQRIANDGAQGYEKPSGFRSFLGNLGDALLVGSGRAPMYGPRQEEKRIGSQLAQYLGANDPQLAELMRTDPGTGMAVLKMKMEQSPQAQKPTALQQNMEYLRQLNPNLTEQQLAEIAQYAIAAPRMYGSPEMGWSPDPNYPFQRGEAQPQDQPRQTAPVAVNPQTGEKLILRDGQWVPMGGSGGNAGGGF